MALEIEEWEIWHTYSTFLETTGVDPSEAARLLVGSGVAECAVLHGGKAFWRSGSRLSSGSVALLPKRADGRAVCSVATDEGSAGPDGFAAEALGQGAYFLAAEDRVFGEATLLPPYLRAYLGKCVLTSASSEGDAYQLCLYPVLTVYETGVMLVEFRMIGPSEARSLPDFVRCDVNLFRTAFDNVKVNPAISRLAPRVYNERMYQGTLANRLRFIRFQAGHEIAVGQQTQEQTDESFSFNLAPLSSSRKDSLRSLALTIFYIAAYVVGRPRVGLSFLLRGQRPALPLGEFWSGRPHIHIVRFKAQCETASENELRHGPDFGRIMARVVGVPDDDARATLPTDARLMEDYNAYVRRESSLWVWSAGGLSEQADSMDRNRGNLIYERQILAELLEYGYMLHRSLYHRLETFGTTAEVLSVRRQILELRRKMHEASPSGEITELLTSGWKEFGLPELAHEIDEGLRLRESETRSIEAARSERVGWAIAIIFGLVAVPPLADQVIRPLWNAARLHPFVDDSLAALVFDGVAFAVVLFSLWLVFLLTLRRGR